MTTYDDAQAAAAKVVDDAIAAAQADTATAQSQLAYANAQIASAATAATGLQAQIDAITAQDKSDKATLAAIQAAFTAYQASHPDAPPVVIAPVVTEFKDFAVQGYAGMYSAAKGLAGSGVTASVYQMAANSSTKAAATNAIGSGSTNPLFVMDFGGHSASASAAGLDIGGFELRGTPQGSEYNGMRVGYSTGAKIHDLLIDGIPGSGSSPPHETFSLDVWRTTDASLARIVLDGRIAGTPQGGSLLGYNFNAGTTTADDIVANYASNGFAVAMWQCSGIQIFNRGDFRHCRKALNIEQAVGGSYVFNACDFRGLTGADYIAQVSSINTSAKVVIADPVVDSYPVKVNCFGASATNVQKDSDITMTIGGKDVTADKTKFLITHE